MKAINQRSAESQALELAQRRRDAQRAAAPLQAEVIELRSVLARAFDRIEALETVVAELREQVTA